jgi:hypothetical protein
MELIVNDCSLHGQFPAVAPFLASLKVMLALRHRLERSQRVLRCPRKLLDATVIPNYTLRQALGSVHDRNLRSVVTTWLAQKGPFWDDERLHSGDDMFWAKGEIVTDTGLAEAAMGVLQGFPRSVVSFAPSDWNYSPVVVEHTPFSSGNEHIPLANYWSEDLIEQHLRETRPPLRSWDGLVQWAKEQCPRLTLTTEVIQAMDGRPFVPGAAERFQELLSTLDRLKGQVSEGGSFTEEGLRIHQAHFVGEKAWFTDSSDGEKLAFKNELSFPDPEQPAAKRLCGWHGKVKIEQMRMHFTYPLRKDAPLYVVYIGPKITKR